jgi:tetratricopeptide (TPR) repeat protein
VSSKPGAPSWTRVRALYEELSELPEEQRELALTRTCGDDEALHQAVRRLLVHDSAEGDSFLGAPLARLAPLAPAEGFELAPGSALGEFRIVRRLGQGGMGAVYEAEQQHPQRRVALKVLRPELSTPESLRRFDIEVESLARMQHPDIARVHAAGIHAVEAEGLSLRLPWYAMELVVGARDLASHARERALAPTQCALLLARVAEAVHHAHLRGIVHRDLKPANVLVDESGAPKVIDFGIARAVDAPANADTTRTGALLGTPRYMAPEQRRGSADVDARCDVWALGRLLRELLAPERSHGEETASASAPSMARTMPRELAWIASRATAELPDERYGSALALAEDLRRFLRGEAVLAAPPGFIYEWAKLLKRHRKAFLAAASVLLALGAGLVVTRRALGREREANLALAEGREESETRRRAAEAASMRAERELGLRSATLDLVRRTISTARNRFGADLKVAQLVAELGRELERTPSADSLLVGGSWSYLADVALASGDLAEAERLQRNALRTFEGLAMDHQAWREKVLGLCGLAEILRSGARLEECAAAIREAEQIARREGLEDDLRCSILRRKVLLALQLRRFPEALAFAEENLALRERIFGAHSPQFAEALLDRGVAAVNAPDTAEALGLLSDALERAEVVLGPLDQRILIGKNNLASACAQRADWARAAELLEEAAEAFGSLYGAEHPSALAMRSNLANTWTRLGREADAAQCFEELLAIALRLRSVRPIAELELLELRRMASISHRRSGDLARAVAVVAEASPFVGADDAPTFEKRCACRLECARALAQQGERDDARGLLEETREALLGRVGERHALVSAVERELAAQGGGG